MAVDRNTPTAGPLSGTDYAAGVDEEVGALWNVVTLPLESVAGADAITATLSPTLDAYAKGQRYGIVPAAASTGAVTLDIDSRGAKALKDADGNALLGGELVAGRYREIVYDGTDFRLLPGANDDLVSANGARSARSIDEEEITLASGSFVDSTVQIPAGALVWAVSSRVTQAITGASSFDLGVAGETAKFGGTLSVALASTNRGLIGPDPFYSAVSVRVTANGSSFTGGKVRIAIHYWMPEPPTG